MPATALRNAATEAAESGDLPKALKLTLKALERHPGESDLWYNLSLLYTSLEQPVKATRAARKAVRLDPNDTDFLLLLALLLQSAGDYSNAAGLYHRAAGIDGGADLLLTEIECLSKAKLDTEALQRIQQMLQLHPRNTEAQFLLAQHQSTHGFSLKAESGLRKVLRAQPGHQNAWATLANVYMKRGDTRRTIRSIRSLLNVNAALPEQHSSLLWTMLHSTEAAPRTVFREQLQWAKLHLESIAESSHHANTPDPNRRLRIGYISDAFKESAISFCDEIILAAHDRSQFEIFLYSDTGLEDSVTERRKQLADHWRDIRSVSHEDAAQLIRRDAIDILLNQCDYHWNRMMVFARKPAPVQMALPYYPFSTGVPQIDYFLTDPRTMSSPAAGLFTEQLLGVPHLLTYWPRPYAPRVHQPPVLKNGFVTFGAFHRLLKLNPEVIALWSRILKAVPGSRLLMHHTFGNPVDEAIPRQVRRWFEPHGVSMDRIELVGTLAQPAHYELYHRIDIALDAFPYSGHTTTCTSIWMGVPVVTLRGETHVARVSASILESVKLTNMIADSPGEYATIAIRLASDPVRLKKLRAALRQRMRESPIMDGRAVAKGLEKALRLAWRRWCEACGA